MDKTPWTKYFWIVLAFIFAIVILGSLPTPAKSQTLDQLSSQLFNNAVQIGDFCSGTIIHSDRDKESGEAETVILTAKHCLINKDRVTINTFEYDKSLRKVKTIGYEATVLGSSYKSDLALIKLNDKQTVFKNVAKIAPSDIELKFAQPTFIVSYPLGLSMTYTQGTLGFVEVMDGFKSASNSREFFRSTPDVKGGSSGSGLFTMNGEDIVLIGTTTGQWNNSTFMNYFTPIYEIREYWDVAKRVLKTQGQ
jgi:S1-C subfamily serine protease